MKDKEIINHVKANHSQLRSYIVNAISLGVNMMLVYLSGTYAFKRPNWFGLNSQTYNTKMLEDTILAEFDAKPGMYGYGILLGKQPGGFYLLCIDIDIDGECKDDALQYLEKVFQKYKISYAKETTKSGRYHVYVAVDDLTDTLRNTKKLKYRKNCVKYKGVKEVEGEIELLGASSPHMSTVYAGVINDEVPVINQQISINSKEILTLALLEFQKPFEEDEDNYDKKRTDYNVKHTKEEDPPRYKFEQFEEAEDEETEDIEFDIDMLVEFFKLVRKYNYTDGWDIEKIVSAICVNNKVPDDDIRRIFEEIYQDEYDEKRTDYIIEHTKEKGPQHLPTIASVIHHAEELATDNRLDEEEKKFLSDFIASFKKYPIPNYLLDAEKAYFLDSIEKKSKDKLTYYREKWYIEKNIDNIKQVWHVEIETTNPGDIYKPHRKVGYSKIVGIKIEISKLLKEQNNKVYEIIINDERIFRPSFAFDKVEEIVKEIEKECHDLLAHFDIPLFLEYFNIKIMEYLKKHNGKPIPCLISKITGWSEDNKLFFHYDLNDEKHELSRDNPLYKHNRAMSFNQEEQHKLVLELLKEGKILGELLVVSASSILLKPFNLQALTYILAGNPGAGKTTASLFATSLFYSSKELLLNADTTRVGVELLLAALNSLPITVDEGALLNSGLDIRHLIFSVASGKGRLRGRKDLTVDIKDLKSNVFFTSETTDIDDIRRAGTFRRMIYRIIEGGEDFTSLFNIKTYRPNRLFAGCGVDYIRFAIENLDVIEERLAIETEDFGVKYSEIAGMAETLYAGIILLEMFYSELNKQQIVFHALRENIHALLEDTKRIFIAAKTDIVFAFEQYLFNNLNRLGQVDFDTFLSEEGVKKPVLRWQPQGKEILGEYDRTTQTFYITKRGMEIIAKELEKERTLLHKALYQAGVISKDMEPKYLKLLGGTHRVYIVKFNQNNQMSIKSASNDG